MPANRSVPDVAEKRKASQIHPSLYIANDHAPTANSQIHPSTVSRHVSKIASIQFKLIHPHSKYPCRYHFLGRGFLGNRFLPGSGKAQELADLSRKQHDPAVKSILLCSA